MVVGGQSRDLLADRARAVELRRGKPESGRSNHETGRDRKSGPRQLTEARSLASDEVAVEPADVLEGNQKAAHPTDPLTARPAAGS